MSFLTSQTRLRVALVAAAVLTCTNVQAQQKTTDKDVDAGVKISTQATGKEVGLPLYPGSKPHRDDKDDSPAANLGLWGNSFGFKLVVLKMETKDAPEKVAAFYQRALTKYGKVLDCSRGSAARNEKPESKSASALTCDTDDSDKGGQVFKAGTKHRQHIVGIQPKSSGSVFQLVYVETRGVDGDSTPQ